MKHTLHHISAHSLRKALAMLLLLALSACSVACGEGHKTPGRAGKTALSSTGADALAYSNHFALRGHEWGPCDRFVGDAYIILVFISTPLHPWTQSVKDQVNNASWSSIANMEREAGKYGASLNLRFGGLDYTVPYEQNSDLKWYNYLMEEVFHVKSIKELYEYYQSSLCADTVSMVFLFNSNDRSHTYMTSCDYPYWNEEFSVIFCDPSLLHDNLLTHEVLHLYGAIDLYDYSYEGVQRISERYFPASVMRNGRQGVDELTAYLIGWKSTLSSNAKAFLNETQGLR